MKQGKAFCVGVALLAFAMTMVWSSEGNSAPAAKPTAPGVGRDYVRIGSFMAITGIIARTTMESEKGFRSYLNYINEKGGVHGREIVVLTEDDGYSETKALLAVKKLVERDKVFLLFNSFGTGPTMATIPYIKGKGIPFIAPGCGSRLVYEPVKKNIFGGPWGVYNYMIEALIPYLVKDLGYKKIAYTYYNDEAGKDQQETVLPAMSKLGLKLAVDLPFERGVADFGPYIARLKAAEPEVVLIYSSTPDMARIIVQSHEMGFRPVFAGHVPAADRILLDLAKKEAEGVIAASPLFPVDSDNPGMVQYRELLKKYYPDIKPGLWGVLGFGAAKVLVEILQRTGPDLSWAKVIKAAETMKEWEIGIGPPITFTPTDHVGNRGMVVLKVVDGKYVPQTNWLYPKK